MLIADVRKHARPDGGVAPKVVIAPHAGLVYSGSVAATAFGPWARRAKPPRRIVIVGPAHRVAFSGLAVHPASQWRTPLGEIPVAGVTHAELARAPSVVVDPRPFVGEHSLEMHLVMLQAMLPAPFEIMPLSGRRRGSPYRRRGAAPGLGRTGDGRRSLVRPVAFSRSDQRGARSIPKPPGALRRSTPPRSMGSALAASYRSRARSRSLPSATCGSRPASGDIGGRWRGRVTGRRLRRFRLNTRPRRGSPRAIASVCSPPA